MADLVTDPNDPRLTHGVDQEQVPQADVYLVLSEAERAKGFTYCCACRKHLDVAEFTWDGTNEAVGS
jgi:hypothetical protein